MKSSKPWKCTPSLSTSFFVPYLFFFPRRVAELEQENKRLLALSQNGSTSALSDPTPHSEVELLKAQLAAAQERERSLSAQLVASQHNQPLVKLEASDSDPQLSLLSSLLSSPARSTIAVPSAHKSSASLGLMVCLPYYHLALTLSPYLPRFYSAHCLPSSQSNPKQQPQTTISLSQIHSVHLPTLLRPLSLFQMTTNGPTETVHLIPPWTSIQEQLLAPPLRNWSLPAWTV